jgi:hypothetical protein
VGAYTSDEFDDEDEDDEDDEDDDGDDDDDGDELSELELVDDSVEPVEDGLSEGNSDIMVLEGELLSGGLFPGPGGLLPGAGGELSEPPFFAFVSLSPSGQSPVLMPKIPRTALIGFNILQQGSGMSSGNPGIRNFGMFNSTAGKIVGIFNATGGSVGSGPRYTAIMFAGSLGS